jgi:hypothetical protein
VALQQPEWFSAAQTQRGTVRGCRRDSFAAKPSDLRPAATCGLVRQFTGTLSRTASTLVVGRDDCWHFNTEVALVSGYGDDILGLHQPQPAPQAVRSEAIFQNQLRAAWHAARIGTDSSALDSMSLVLSTGRRRHPSEPRSSSPTTDTSLS